jgi:hypothetical protein
MPSKNTNQLKNFLILIVSEQEVVVAFPPKNLVTLGSVYVRRSGI